LGVVNYVGKFSPNVAQVNEYSEPVLQYYDCKLLLILSVDESKDGLDAIILQNNLPIIYASKSLTDTQKKYAQIEKEALGIAFGCQRFHQYIYGRKIYVKTDHHSL
jgi:hypothetical protein